jgi:MFS family permease
MSVVNTVYLGAIGAAAAIGGLAAYFSGSNRVPFYLVTVLLFLSAVTAHLGLPSRTTSAESEEPPENAAGADSAHGQIRRHPLPLVLLITVLMTLGVWTFANFLIVYLKVEFGLSGLGIGTLLAIMAVPLLILGLPLGHAADRWGRTRAVRISLLVSATAMWLIPSCRGIVSFTIIGIVSVLSYLLSTPAWLALVSSLAPRSRRGGVMGIVATAEGAGAGLAPLLGGFLWDIHHSYIFYGSAVFLTVGALVAAYTLRDQRS